jgi:arsenite methyltransferase
VVNKQLDKWMLWLRERRFGGQAVNMDGMFALRDRVLKNAKIKGAETLLDVGCGDGLIGCAALELVGDKGKVIFSDISQDALDHCKAFAESINALERTEFVIASASDLNAIADSSVDIVTTRSVLIYETEKVKAFKEFHRVLKPDGRISLFEPIGRVERELQRSNSFMGYNVLPVKAQMTKVMEAFTWNNDPDNPMGNFDERDLVKYATGAGFTHIKAEMEIETGKAGFCAGDWERFYNSSMNPNAPTLREAVEQQLNEEEVRTFINHLKPLVQAGDGWVTQAFCYLTADK